MPTIKNGFTLIEMVVVMAITGVVVVLAADIFSAGFKNYNVAVNYSTLANQATLAMERISKELQQATGFSSATSTTVSFTTTDGSTISYSFANPVLTRTGSSAQTMSNQMSNFSLAYYQSDFGTALSLTVIKAVTINLTLSNTRESVSLVNTVFLRNT